MLLGAPTELWSLGQATVEEWDDFWLQGTRGNLGYAALVLIAV